MRSGWLIVLTFMATFRVARLVTSDYITRPIRRAARRRLGKTSKRYYLLTCNWCISVWASAGVAVPVVLWPSNRAVWCVLLALSASAATGLIATVADYYGAITPPEPDEFEGLP